MSNITWPLWECLKPEQLAKLIMYQWEHYGTKLDCLKWDPEYNIESLEEIDRLMRQRPRGRPKRG